jgi:hypothetical protein
MAFNKIKKMPEISKHYGLIPILIRIYLIKMFKLVIAPYALHLKIF